MNTETLDKMRRMKLHGMFRAFKITLESGKQETYTADEIAAHLVTAEWEDRENRSINMKIKNAKFRYKGAIEDVNYNANRNIDRNQIMRFTDCSFIDKHENILITGSTGIGKSYIASAIGHHACCQGYRVAYYNTAKLFAKLKMAKADGSYVKEMTRLVKSHLLIVDDFGIQPFDAPARTALMELVEDRHDKGAMIITSQLPVNKWHETIGEQTIADAVMDRLIHNAHRLELKGESMRRKAVIE
jgi:DNA replication protein DnaC